MNAPGMEKRIRKLEGAPKEGLSALTWDELDIQILELAHLVSSSATADAEKRAKARETIARIEADMVSSAIAQASPGYEKHLERIGEGWPNRTGKDHYVPALFYRNGFGEYCDLEMPDIMARRSALREKPIAQEILERVPETTDLRTEIRAGS